MKQFRGFIRMGRRGRGLGLIYKLKYCGYNQECVMIQEVKELTAAKRAKD